MHNHFNSNYNHYTDYAYIGFPPIAESRNLYIEIDNLDPRAYYEHRRFVYTTLKDQFGPWESAFYDVYQDIVDFYAKIVQMYDYEHNIAARGWSEPWFNRLAVSGYVHKREAFGPAYNDDTDIEDNFEQGNFEDDNTVEK